MARLQKFITLAFKHKIPQKYTSKLEIFQMKLFGLSNEFLFSVLLIIRSKYYFYFIKEHVINFRIRDNDSQRKLPQE